MQKMIDKLEAVSADEKLRMQIEADEDARREYINRIDSMKRKTLAEGLEKGREEGREEGKKNGIYESAKKFKELNAPLQMIKDATGLTIEEIDKL